MPTQRVITEDARGELSRLVSRFAQWSFRRRMPKELIAPYAEMALKEFERSKDFITALRLGYRAVLCSPRFLYLREKPGELDDFEVASRLSYMLWNRMPDIELLQLANRGKLSAPETLERPS